MGLTAAERFERRVDRTGDLTAGTRVLRLRRRARLCADRPLTLDPTITTHSAAALAGIITRTPTPTLEVPRSDGRGGCWDHAAWVVS